jgi:hypothetical protein
MWKITDKPTNPGRLNLGFSIDPPNHALSGLIVGTDVYKYPMLVKGVATSGGFANEVSSFLAYDAMDSQDLETAEGIQADEVEVYHEVVGSSFIKEFLFDEIIYDYSLALLKVYKDHIEVQQKYLQWLSMCTAHDYIDRNYYLDFNPNWGLAMEEELQKLKQKIDNRWRK